MRCPPTLGPLLALSSNHSVCNVHVKSVTSVAVQIYPCVGSFTRILTRHLFSAVNSAFSWDTGVLLLDDSISEINFWYNNVDSLNAEFIRGYNRYWSELVFPMLPIQLVVRLSSSPLDWFVCFFFFIRIGPLRKKNRIPLVENLRPFVSPWRPLQGVCPTQGSFAIQTTRTLSLLCLNGSRKLDLQVLTFKHYSVCLALEAFAGRLSNARVIWYSNNQNVESAMSQRQQEIGYAGVNFQALQICPKYHISLDAGWIPKGLDVIADSISNLVDFDDYAI